MAPDPLVDIDSAFHTVYSHNSWMLWILWDVALDYQALLHIAISLDACPPFIPSVLQVPTKVDDQNRANFTLVCHAVDWGNKIIECVSLGVCIKLVCLATGLWGVWVYYAYIGRLGACPIPLMPRKFLTHTGPDGNGDFKVRVEEQRFIGHGSMSPEASGDTNYLYRAAPVSM